MGVAGRKTDDEQGRMEMIVSDRGALGGFMGWKIHAGCAEEVGG